MNVAYVDDLSLEIHFETPLVALQWERWLATEAGRAFAKCLVDRIVSEECNAGDLFGAEIVLWNMASPPPFNLEAFGVEVIANFPNNVICSLTPIRLAGVA